MSIVQLSKDYIQNLLTEQLSTDHRYHDLSHTFGVREACLAIGKELQLPSEDLEVLEIAALFHDTGFTQVYQGHEKASVQIAKGFLKQQEYPKEKLGQVLDCIAVTYPGFEPSNMLEKVIKDADLNNLGSTSYMDTLKNLRYEWEVFFNKKYNDDEWYALNYKFVKHHKYYTSAALRLFGDQWEKNLKQLKKMAKKEKKEKPTPKPGTIEGNKSAQMMFKTALRNHLDLSNLADNKANIMLSVNALIITIAMPLAASYVQDHSFLLLPMITLMSTCLASMIFATLATRPIQMTGYTPQDKIKTGQSNLFFFGNFFKMSFDEYRTGMNHIISDEGSLDSAIMRDLYFLGRSLGMKYSQLRICYNIFMVGVIVTVIIFGICYGINAR